MINISKIFNKINELFYKELSDVEKIVLKMCNGEIPLYDISKYEVFFKYKKSVYGVWVGNGISWIGLHSIDGRCISDDIQRQLRIRRSLRIKLWKKYSKLYEQFKCDLSFKKAKEFEEKYQIKIIKH